MARIVHVLVVLVVLVGVAAGVAAVLATRSEAAPAAEIQRTFVSTSGSDANPCTRAAPCRGFQAALGNTLAGGEVVALDSGGYGTFTVRKAVTVAGAPGAHVAITAFSGTAITVDAGSGDAVVLRNLYVTGLPGASTGVSFVAGGSLHVESVVVSGFGTIGLLAVAPSASLVVRESVFRHNGFHGLLASGTLRAEIVDSRADRNGSNGFSFSDGVRGSVVRSAATRNANNGFPVTGGAMLAVSDSVADGNGVGVLVLDASTNVTVSGTTLSNNSSAGMSVLDGAAVARIGASSVTGNGVGLLRSAGTLETFGDNLVRGNTTNTSGAITTVAKT